MLKITVLIFNYKELIRMAKNLYLITPKVFPKCYNKISLDKSEVVVW